MTGDILDKVTPDCKINEPATNVLLTYASSEGSDELAHTRSGQVLCCAHT